MILWRLTAREVARRPGRATLTLLSIAIAVAALVSISLGTATTREAYRRMYEEISGRSDLQVTAAGNGVFEEADLIAKLQALPEVKAAVPSVQRPVSLRIGSGENAKMLTVILMGIDPKRDREVRLYEVREGEFLQSDHDLGVLLEASFARGAGVAVGDQMELRRQQIDPRKLFLPLEVKGLLAPRGAAAFNKGNVAVVSLGLAQKYYSGPGRITTIDIVAQESTDLESLTRAVESVLPPGLEAHPPAMRTQTAQGTYVSIEQGMRVATAFAVVLALLIITNTFLMNVSERRGQLAILRAIGATRRQIVRLLLLEGLVVGILGSALGCVLGIAGGYFLMTMVTRLYVSNPPPVIFPLRPFVIAALLGPVIAVMAAAIPAWLTARISPVEAMQPVVAQDGRRVPRWITYTGVLLLAASAVLLQFSFRGWISPVLTIPIGVVFMASFVLLVPALLGPLAHAVGLLLRPLLHLEAELADRQVRRRPVRTSLTIGVVYLAVGMGVGLGTTIINNVDQVRQWYGKTVSGDFFLRAQFPNTATGETEQIDPALESEIRKVPGIASIDTVNFFTVQVAGLKPFVFARDFNSYDSDPQGKELPLELYEAAPAEVRAKLLQGEVVVGTVLAHRIGVQPGDWITVNTRHGPQRLQVAALAVDYMVGGDIIYIEQSVARRLFDLKGVNAFVIYAQPGERDRVGTALEELAEQHRLMFQSFADLIKMLDNILYGVIGALWGVMVLGFLVAAFGIANTLTMNVLEQTRELALLRVVAMTRDQVRRMVLSQAGIIGLIGLALGMVAGLNTAKAISLSMMPLLGYPVPFVLHPWLLAGSFLAGMALVLIAAYWPARRAAKLDLLIALQYE